MIDKRKDLRKRIERTKTEAHERVVKDGTIQFRVDGENMERILHAADELGVGAGVLARMWVLERLNLSSGAGTSTPSISYASEPIAPRVQESEFAYEQTSLSDGLAAQNKRLDKIQKTLDAIENKLKSGSRRAK